MYSLFKFTDRILLKYDFILVITC